MWESDDLRESKWQSDSVELERWRQEDEEWRGVRKHKAKLCYAASYLEAV